MMSIILGLLTIGTLFVFAAIFSGLGDSTPFGKPRRLLLAALTTIPTVVMVLLKAGLVVVDKTLSVALLLGGTSTEEMKAHLVTKQIEAVLGKSRGDRHLNIVKDDEDE